MDTVPFTNDLYPVDNNGLIIDSLLRNHHNHYIFRLSFTVKDRIKNPQIENLEVLKIKTKNGIKKYLELSIANHTINDENKSIIIEIRRSKNLA